MSDHLTARLNERLKFFDGQRLDAADLQALDTYHREMRWWHNRSLHQPGIGAGLNVIGKKGERAVLIQPGYALDDLGREIVLTEARLEPIPPVAGPIKYHLTAAYQDDGMLTAAETRSDLCDRSGTVRLKDVPALCWVPAAGDAKSVLQRDILVGRRLILATVKIVNCQLDEAPDPAQRRSARPPRQPYVAGAKAVGVWTVWNGTNGSLGISTHVDTSEYGFNGLPIYSARIEGDRPITVTAAPVGSPVFKLAGTERSAAAVAGSNSTFVDGTTSIMDASRTGFTLNVMILDTASGAVAHLSDARKFNDWHVVWLGIEG
ncbi:MAG: hypothetical protein ACH37Z_04205 [Anaerolineae bacterium]